jgi:hypothetical protein
VGKNRRLNNQNKKNKKVLKNPLTNGVKYDIINTERGKENRQNQKERNK